MKKHTFHSSEQGIAIIISVLMVGIILAIVFALSAIFLPKLRSAAEVKSSVSAAYAAESALEWCLYVHNMDVVPSPVPSDPDVTFTVTDCDKSPVTAVGTYRGVTRAFELSF